MKNDVIEQTFYQDQDYIAEVIFDYYLQPEIQFVVFDKVSKTVSYHPQLELTSGTVVKPLQLDLIKEKKILLPSSADEYTSEENLLKELQTFINFYLDLPHPFYLKLVSQYVLLTWVYDKLSVVPYLRAVADYGSGKTRFAQVVGALSYKPLFLAGATSDAFIFRMVELFKGTMIINELERVNTDLQSQIVNILNNGYERGLYVGRVEGDKKREPKVFDPYCPKIITSRRKFKDLALESRILTIPMKPTKRNDIPSLLDQTFWDSAQDLRNKLLMYRFRNLCLPQLENKESLLSGVEPRLKQTLLPLLYVAQNPEIEQELIKYAVEFQEQIFTERSFESDAIVAEKLLNLIENNEKVTVKDVAEKVNLELEDKERLTTKAVGLKIRGFGFKTKRVQGVYQIIPNQTVIDYLTDRYNFNKSTIEESPLSPQSPPLASGSEVDLGDMVDIKSVDQLSEEQQLALGKQVFGDGTRWADGN